MIHFFTIAASATFTLLVTGCATQFVGSAYVESGRSGCETKCGGQGMEVVGMVYMGEYSDACICAVPGQGARGTQALAAGAAAAGGSAGVVMQQQRQQQAHHNR
ncbi:MAG: hypothetical protein RJA70_1244 [Pseudomonadota bacterium]|jgi:hypothetical protein